MLKKYLRDKVLAALNNEYYICHPRFNSLAKGFTLEGLHKALLPR